MDNELYTLDNINKNKQSHCAYCGKVKEKYDFPACKECIENGLCGSM